MSKKLHLLLATTLVTGALIFSSCEKEAEKDVYPEPIPLPKSGKIYFLNELYSFDGSIRLDIKISDSLIASNFPNTGSGTPYLSVPVGTQTLNWVNHDDGTVIHSAPVTIDQNKSYAAFVTVDQSGTPVHLFVENDLTDPATGNTHLRFVHLSPDAPNVDVSLWETSRELTSNDDKDFSNDGAGLSFTVTQSLKLDSIAVKSVTGTAMNIYLYDSAGTSILQNSGPVSLVTGEMKKVYLGWSLQPGTYRIIAGNLNGSFIGSDQGVVYPAPLTDLGIARINGSVDSPDGTVNPSSGKYYYFYDWDFKVVENIFSNSAFLTATPYAPFVGGEYDIVVTVAGSPGSIALRVDDVPFAKGRIYTLFARGYVAPGAAIPLTAAFGLDK